MAPRVAEQLEEHGFDEDVLLEGYSLLQTVVQLRGTDTAQPGREPRLL